MPIYVDPIRNTQYPENGDWPFAQSSHLFADSKEELIAFADTIRLKTIWLHYSRKYLLPHFDITASKRKLAVSKGAIELSKRETVEFMKKYLR